MQGGCRHRYSGPKQASLTTAELPLTGSGLPAAAAAAVAVCGAAAVPAVVVAAVWLSVSCLAAVLATALRCRLCS